MRVAVALYATDPTVRTHPSTGAQYKSDAVLNLYPTDHSFYEGDPLISTEEQEYPNDPFIVAAPWMKSGTNPGWLSYYGYLIKPLTREPMFKLLATKGPRLLTELEYQELSALYDDQGGPILAALLQNPETYFAFSDLKSRYYANVLLDWADLLGEETCLWGLGWVSSTFGLGPVGGSDLDSFMGTHGLSDHSFLASWLSMLYQLQLQSSVYFPIPEGWKPKRFPASINHPDWHVGSGWDWIDANKYLMPIGSPYLEGWPHLTFPEGRTMMVAGSSLSIPLAASTPMEYAWQPSLPPCFGQWRVFGGPDIYQAMLYPYLPVSSGTWTWIHNIPGIPEGIFNTMGPMAVRTWWPWYQSLPWAGWWDNHTILSIDHGIGLFGELLDSMEDMTPQTFSKFPRVQKLSNPQFWFSTAYYPIQNIQVLARRK